MKVRKTAALFLIFALLSGSVPVYAADAEPTVLDVSYSSIEGYVRSSNQTIRSNAKTLDALRNNDLASEKISDLQSSAASLSSVGNMLGQADSALKSLPASAETQAIDASLQGSIASISAISSVLSSEEDQLQTNDEKVDETELQMNSAADQVVMAAQKLFVTFNTLNSQRSFLTKQQQIIADRLKAAQMKTSLGLMTQAELMNAVQQQTAEADELAGLVSQMKTVKDNLRVLLGYSSDYDLNLSSVPQADVTAAAAMNYSADYQTALGANWTLQERQKDTDIADEDYDSGLSSTVAAHNAAALQYELAKNTFDASFRQVFDDVAMKQSLLASAQSDVAAKSKTLEAVKLQNQFGAASALDLENAQLAEDEAVTAEAQAQINLFSSQEQYRWALCGTLNQTSSSQTGV